MTIPVKSLPPVIAILNGAAGFFLVLAYIFIRKKKIAWHRFCIFTALGCSAVFLTVYLYMHFAAGVIRFSGQGWIRPVYFSILFSHTILAVVIVPLVFITLVRALKKNFIMHRAIARWTFPLWLYVSVTGVVVYWLLYVAYPPIWPVSTAILR
jgi:putative membrane protein